MICRRLRLPDGRVIESTIQDVDFPVVGVVNRQDIRKGKTIPKRASITKVLYDFKTQYPGFGRPPVADEP